MAEKFILEKFVDDKWYMVGVYGKSFIQPLCNAVIELSKAGFEMYETIRVRVE